MLIRIDDRNYRAEVKRAQASVASAQTQVTRETGLADYAEADWKRAKPLLSSSKAASDLALRKPQLAEAIANLDFARAELDKREGDLDRTVIRAPYDGMVRQKRADIGQYVALGTQLAVTFAIDVAEVR
ncbi:MAG TPA: efflux transporter periplasmic adaptor subunit, partial [Gammaproteobacteria bacterium]|nr:efflux transporter periplasmic adaptor subunit [Gammaproteobacteria bacterium]